MLLEEGNYVKTKMSIPKAQVKLWINSEIEFPQESFPLFTEGQDFDEYRSKLIDFLFLIFQKYYVRTGAEVSSDLPPKSLYHIFQVEIIAKALAANSNTREPFFGLTPEQVASCYALIHDIGRALDMPLHPFAGYIMTKTAIKQNNGNDTSDFNKKLQRFTLAHHTFGLGFDTEFLGKIKNSINLSGQKVEVDSEKLNQIFDELYEIYGLGGLCAQVADLSKERTEEYMYYVPGIYSLEQGLSLVENQINKYEEWQKSIMNGNPLNLPKLGYPRDSEQYKTELHGIYFIQYLIQYLKDRFGINYEQCIQDSQTQMDSMAEEIELRWRETNKI